MKITITSETTGTEVVENIVQQLAASSVKIDAKAEEIKTQVVNAKGEWCDFSPAKIRFIYSK